jgi:large subunit ribosomal protein L19
MTLLFTQDKFLNVNPSHISIGDNLKVRTQVTENNKTRYQRFDGIVIRKKGSGNKTSITLRSLLHGVYIEVILFLYSPLLVSLEIKNSSKVRKSKLYYLRLQRKKSSSLKVTSHKRTQG